ncbi:TAF6-like RNA polymerase II p300/CBP-associated factor-associated factor 65 kDa subunit 6L isoform X2 [Centruroides sculpturatus]|uniref:TAF6-like RNA polymerase II p300/CBP-associated factor-associated factor 65 kDa subunit 6L isoform X2 n=1 Tax=Centruroides sculpturatus TaxID=218467 RepID=UPI000C6DC013|nr:TAF6-like RNA polymerase II p300/CBP-associated factor-associated factor 65 kDa subunit 6L isoform X2 [Centruroides sculpturatus]
MSEEKKSVEEKKYSQLCRENIKMFAETVGYSDLPDCVASCLAEDVNYRLRETIQNAGQFMRHAKRRKLCVEDINRTLRWNDVELLYGYGSSEPLPMKFIKEADVFSVEENEVNLVNLATTNTTAEQPGEIGVKAYWLAVEGVSKCGLSQNSIQNKKNGHVETLVSEELMAYYEQVTKAILGNNEELLNIALNDLRTNAKIAPLLPYLVNFVSVGVKKMSHDLTQLTKLLHTVFSLVRNPSLYLGPKPYLNLLVQAVLYCILEPLAASINPINDHWTLRDTAAQLLVQIVKEWSTPTNDLMNHVISSLEESFVDLSKPFCSHYGAVVALISFGVETAEKIIYPHLTHYWPHLTAALENCNYSNAQVKADAQKVHGVLLKAEFGPKCDDVTEDMESDSLNSDLQLKTSNNYKNDSVPKGKLQDIYKQLYDYFGDALAIKLPHISIGNIYKPKEYPVVNLFSTPELLQSGEELLEVFYDKDEEMKSNSLEDDNSYDERDDNSSDEHETDPVDLQIKSTISDPTLGIKLTIAKLRRNKPVKEAKNTKVKKKIFKPTKEQQENEPVFDYPPAKCHTSFLEFNFEGGIPVKRDCLKRREFFSTSQDHLQFSSVASISQKMKKSGKKKINPKLLYQRKFISGNLMINL